MERIHVLAVYSGECDGDHAGPRCADAQCWNDEAPPKGDDRYWELILAVGNKYHGETRHETALRYIRQAEQSGGESACTESQA